MNIYKNMMNNIVTEKNTKITISNKFLIKLNEVLYDKGMNLLPYDKRYTEDMVNEIINFMGLDDCINFFAKPIWFYDNNKNVTLKCFKSVEKDNKLLCLIDVGDTAIDENLTQCIKIAFEQNVQLEYITGIYFVAEYVKFYSYDGQNLKVYPDFIWTLSLLNSDDRIKILQYIENIKKL